HVVVASSDVVRSSCALLAETAAYIGDAQVRNRGTMGGSVAHADPAADYPTALTALGATVETGGGGGGGGRGRAARTGPVRAYGRGTGGAYLKHRHPASSFAVVGVAALVTVDGGKCSKVSLVV